ncbi:hypothetical protein HanXRQr2_Chr10g0464701 [Helianthus annuus]|uniref:Uncharacterized protein n=1 Tax=Helianthus annuus TaxID=4232 RepID=A0A9K3I1E9_HELAN|nr:hypothetical protein HanXRQr2_Chr10g0464701 [Helianthus annuus]
MLLVPRELHAHQEGAPREDVPQELHAHREDAPQELHVHLEDALRELHVHLEDAHQDLVLQTLHVLRELHVNHQIRLETQISLLYTHPQILNAQEAMIQSLHVPRKAMTQSLRVQVSPKLSINVKMASLSIVQTSRIWDLDFNRLLHL